MRIVSVGCAHPPHYYTQDQVYQQIEGLWGADKKACQGLRRFLASTSVEGRYFALPLEEYPKLKTFGESNNAYIQAALDVSEKAITTALQQANLPAEAVDAIFFVSVTGLAVPTIDSRLVHRMGFRTDIKRYPLFGLGCAGGAAGTARLNDYLKGHPDGVALLVCLELCSLTFQMADLSIPNMISASLFGDGCGAVIAVGAEHRLYQEAPSHTPRAMATTSHLYPSSEHLMGWDISEQGFKIVLSNSIADLVFAQLPQDIDGFLDQHQIQRQEIDHWICHPGGPRIIDAVCKSLDLEESAIAITQKSLGAVGNMSSASILFVLAETLETRTFQPGQKGLMMALGPGFCSELVLLEWG